MQRQPALSKVEPARRSAVTGRSASGSEVSQHQGGISARHAGPLMGDVLPWPRATVAPSLLYTPPSSALLRLPLQGSRERRAAGCGGLCISMQTRRVGLSAPRGEPSLLPA